MTLKHFFEFVWINKIVLTLLVECGFWFSVSYKNTLSLSLTFCYCLSEEIRYGLMSSSEHGELELS